MKGVKKYVIDYRNLHIGQRTWQYSLPGEFFRKRGSELISEGDVEVQISVDKRANFGVLTLSHEGLIKTACDRCLKEIECSISGEVGLIVKEVNDNEQTFEEEILLTDAAGRLELANPIYDYVSLSVPMIKYCNTVPPCNSTIMTRLGSESSKEGNPAWNELRKLKF